jgi:sRNA-binding carbon storage regulator CsrA
MLVIARKRHEAVTIDGTIRVEVLCLAPGVARLRIVVPRGVAIQRGVRMPGDPAACAREACNGGSDAAGREVVDLTVCGQQIVTVHDDIHVGLMDVDATRAVLFFDTPETAHVNVESARRPRAAGRSSSPAADAPVQALLPFSMPAEAAAPANGVRASRKSAGDAARENPAPSTIPFPWAGMGEERPE